MSTKKTGMVAESVKLQAVVEQVRSTVEKAIHLFLRDCLTPSSGSFHTKILHILTLSRLGSKAMTKPKGGGLKAK